MFDIDNRDTVLAFFNVAYELVANAENMPNVPDSLTPTVEHHSSRFPAIVGCVEDLPDCGVFADVARQAALLKAPPIGDGMDVLRALDRGISR